MCQFFKRNRQIHEIMSNIFSVCVSVCLCVCTSVCVCVLLYAVFVSSSKLVVVLGGWHRDLLACLPWQLHLLSLFAASSRQSLLRGP